MSKKTTAKKDTNTPVVYAYGVVNDAMATMVAQSLDFYSAVANSIDVHLNSSGGSVYHGAAVYNCIKNCKVPVDVYIDGVAASMGAYSAFGGNKVYISKFGRIMLHEGQIMEGGTVDELRANANEVEACNNNLVAITCDRTGMSDADVRARFFNGKDNWLSAREALQMKLVDGIYDIDEVNIPEAANHIEVYARMSEAYQNGILKTENHMEFKAAKEVLAAVGLKEGASEAEYNLAVMAMAKKNNDLTLQVQAQKDEEVKKAVEAQLTEAFDKKKITASFKTVLATQYATNPDGLKLVLAELPVFTSVVGKLNQTDTNRDGAKSYTPEVMALMAKGWDSLDKGSQLKKLKAADPEAYVALYEGKFGYKPNEKPEPKP